MKRGRCLTVLGAVLVGLMWAAPSAAQDAAKPKVMPHDGAGREQCLMCHGGAMESMPVVPATHEGKENPTCLLCHSAESPVQGETPPPAIPHDLAGRDQCRMCHSGAMEGVPAVPENHGEVEVQYCGLCHKPAG